MPNPCIASPSCVTLSTDGFGNVVADILANPGSPIPFTCDAAGLSIGPDPSGITGVDPGCFPGFSGAGSSATVVGNDIRVPADHTSVNGGELFDSGSPGGCYLDGTNYTTGDGGGAPFLGLTNPSTCRSMMVLTMLEPQTPRVDLFSTFSINFPGGPNRIGYTTQLLSRVLPAAFALRASDSTTLEQDPVTAPFAGAATEITLPYWNAVDIVPPGGSMEAQANFITVATPGAGQSICSGAWGAHRLRVIGWTI